MLKYHRSQPRSASGSWTLPSGEHHPLNGGEVQAHETDDYLDLSFVTHKTFDVGGGVQVKMPDTIAVASAFKDTDNKQLILTRLNVQDNRQGKGIGSAMLAEMAQGPMAVGHSFRALNITSERGKKFLSGMVRRGLASGKPEEGVAFNNEALTTKYKRMEATSDASAS